MTLEKLESTLYVVTEARYIRALWRKVKETRPKNAPTDYDKLRDIENLINLMIGEASDLDDILDKP